MPYSEDVKDPLLSLATAALVSSPSDLSVWMNSGRRLIDRVWSSSHAFAVLLTGTLSELSWGGFKQFAFPSFISHCLQLLESGDLDIQSRTLRELAVLVKTGLLKDIDDGWRARFGSWVRSKLDGKALVAEEYVSQFIGDYATVLSEYRNLGSNSTGNLLSNTSSSYQCGS